MKESEALEDISDFAIGVNQDVSNLSLAIAIEALEKQIPKDIIRENGEIYKMSLDGKPSYLIVLKCPTCGRTDLERDYPCKCGQLLKWGE